MVTFTLARWPWATGRRRRSRAHGMQRILGIALRAGELSAATGAFRHAERAGCARVCKCRLTAAGVALRCQAAAGHAGGEQHRSKAQVSTRDAAVRDGDGPPKQPL